MKRTIISTIALLIMLILISVCAQASEIVLYSPGEDETEIMPLRDFYVVGTIDRNGKSASENPLNISIELWNKEGEIIRSLKSNVLPNGVTSAEMVMTDYDAGHAYEDAKGINLITLTHHDILFDGSNRDTIRSQHTKIIVKDNYFAAVIYGGATKDFDLRYEDESEKALKDITEGKYTLIITATDLDDNEVCKLEKTLVFDNEKARVIAKDADSLKGYFEEGEVTLNNSIVGKWKPSEYFNADKNFLYTINNRYIENIKTEYSSESIYILLDRLSLTDSELNYKFGSAFNKENKSKTRYLHYNTGEKLTKFNFADADLENSGVIVENEHDRFVNILRAETPCDDLESYIDFNSEDGIILTEGKATRFYGIYSPIITSATEKNGKFNIADMTTEIKAMITDNNGKVLYDKSVDLFLNEEDNTFNYQFMFEIEADDKMADERNLLLHLELLDSNGETILSGEKINLKVNSSGDFIEGYDQNYWGKSFCDTINFFGQTPSSEALTPDEYIKRGDFAAMINRLFGFAIKGSPVFSDIDEENIYYEDCLTANAAGYMSGDEHARVKADQFISREEAMIILARISKAKMGEKSIEFIDSEEISFWAKDYVDIMCSNGIVSGFEGYLHPTDSITVAEASALIIKTFRWMYNYTTENKSDASDENVDMDISDMEMSEIEFISTPTKQAVEEFFSLNKAVFEKIAAYLTKNCPNGAYVGKVGNGLEIRDYKFGNILSFTQNSVDVITKMSSYFTSFAIKYNPMSENAIHFALGQSAEGKEIGITYTPLEEVKGKELHKISENWYCYIRK